MMGGGLGLELLTLEEQRELMDAAADMFPVAPDVRVQAVDAGGVVADRVHVGSAATDRCVLYLHGGAYVSGSRTSHRSLAARLARAAGATVLLPEYRLAPEHPFPAALDDARDSWHFLLKEGWSANRIAVAGDSAGGGLALALLLALRDAGEPLPACAIGISPWTDLDRSEATVGGDALTDPLLSLDGLLDNGAMYAGSEARNPLASPVFGDLSGLPPLLLQSGTRDLLTSDSSRVAERARAAGVDVTLELHSGLIHVWHMYPHVPEAQRALERIGAFVRAHCRG